MTKDSLLFDVYIDETELTLNGRHCYLYAALIPHDLSAAIDASVALKREHGLDGAFEAKWSSQGGDPAVKARLKEALLDVLTRHFTCLLNLTATDDKNEAFLNLLTQVEKAAVGMDRRYVNLYYDQDAFRSAKAIRAALDAWTSAQCTTFACLDSAYSVPIQFADLLAGAFRYVLLAAFGAITPKVVSRSFVDDAPPEDWRLDHLFHVALRWCIPGVTPHLDPNAPSCTPSDFMKDCFGSGIVVNGPFSPAELETFRSESVFYIGCMS